MNRQSPLRPAEAGEGEGEIEHSVLAYLRSHPQAADTLRGIVNWWLPLQRYESGCVRIEHALVALVARGELCCKELPGGEVLYGLCNHTS
ncbi:MAG: hypothetical protein ABI129_05150 [Rhodanobacter sp.]